MNFIMEYGFFALIGVMFGLANVIPGVSGGTIAVVFGIYERLIGILADFRHKWREEWKFLLAFGAGAGVGIVVIGKMMNWLLETYPTVAAAFFAGVIIGSIPMLAEKTFMKKSRRTGKKHFMVNLGNILPGVVTLGIMIFMVVTGDGDKAAAAGPAGNLIVQMLLMLLAGVIAASCMIIPGISGSFVLVLIGLYKYVIAAVSGLDLVVLAPFGIGALVGLVFCAKLIRFLLEKFEMPTYSAILGFVIGSVFSVFPGFAEMAAVAPIISFVVGLAAILLCNKFSAE